MLTRRCTVSSRTASTAAASIKCARILRSCAVCRTCFFRGAVRFAGHCWGRTHCRARFARPACPRKCTYSTFRRVCRRANTIFTPCGRLPRRIITRILYVQPFCAASGAAAFGTAGSWRTVCRAGVWRTAGQTARKNAAVCGCDRAAAV